jgi:hypothetical protein
VKCEKEGNQTTDEDSGRVPRKSRSQTSSRVDWFQGRPQTKTYRKWSPDGSRDRKQVSGRKEWDSEGDGGSPQGKAKSDPTLLIVKQTTGTVKETGGVTYTLHMVDRKDGETLSGTSATLMKRVIAPEKGSVEAMNNGERPAGVMVRDGNDPLEDETSGLLMMKLMTNDARRGVVIGEATHPEGTGTMEEDA